MASKISNHASDAFTLLVKIVSIPLLILGFVLGVFAKGAREGFWAGWLA